MDRSKGIWRRLIAVPFEVQVPEEKQNKNLIKPSFWRQSGELPGIFNWAVAGFMRLRARGRFEEPQKCKDIKAEFRLVCNPGKDFLVTNYEIKPSQKLSSHDLYRRYRCWAEERGVQPLRESGFVQEVKRTFPGIIRTINAVRQSDGSRGHEWIGIRRIL